MATKQLLELVGYKLNWRLYLWLGAAALAFGIFVDVTKDLLEAEVDAIDQAILLAIAKARAPWLTIAAVDLTALGSITLVILFSVVALGLLLVVRDRRGALQLLFASAGSGILTLLTKNLIERERPTGVSPLIEVSGYSYPSGHTLADTALYLTIAIIAVRHVQNSAARITIFVTTFVILALVALSRVYLGVHYPTDVVGGMSLGAAWALLLAAPLCSFALAERLECFNWAITCLGQRK